MTICVYGLWHLGCVTAACLAEHFDTVALDPDAANIARLEAGKPPILEPELADLMRAGQERGKLRFTTDAAGAVGGAAVVWVTFDTPVNESDEADSAYVERMVESIFPYLKPEAIVLVSSQLPVGSTAQLAARYREQFPNGSAAFACAPENLRLGKAVQVFRHPDRIVVGVPDAATRAALEPLLAPFSRDLIWMSVASAEMTKHAVNAFLANSVVFINEIAGLCEEVGADAKEVERGLKSEERIGPRAYLGAGSAFSGGTLARDVAYLTARARQHHLATPLLASIRESNEGHKQWARRKLVYRLGTISGKTIAVLGLTYKPGTDTLRRSASIELCRWIAEQGGAVHAYDPAVKDLPEELRGAITRCNSAAEALTGADAAVVATEWPEFLRLTAADFTGSMRTPIVLDPNRFLEKSLGTATAMMYSAVGMPKETQ